MRKDSEFERPLDRNLLLGVKPQPKQQIDLGEMMALNRGQHLPKSALEETPMVKGYKMLKATLLREKPVEESPLITWGKIEDTMFLGETKGNKYKVQESSDREVLGMRMANQSMAKKREQKLM